MSSVTSTFALPRRQNALVVAGPGQLSLHQDEPLAHVAPDMALVRTVAVAVNPVDAKMLDYSPAVGAIHGYDFAGVVVALGSDAPRHLSIGDRGPYLKHPFAPSAITRSNIGKRGHYI